MPSAPLRPCPIPGCPELIRSGRCVKHGGPADVHRWDTDRRPVERVRGRRLQALRAQLFTHEPLCRACAALGLVRAATIRDHIVPLFEGGDEDDTNIQPLCQTCSDAKTHVESLRGRQGGSLNR